ncbi:MAG TPA: RIP metalloprotease RseP [Niastella sp.]|nr:RIP metalloprotease RseP [Niastella sp.]
MMHLIAMDWSVIGVKAGQFILSFSILVVLHELGHFLPAKWFGCRVDKFYLFFNPGFSLFKKQVGETEYGLGWIPFGGYVKIAGMVDESMDKEQLKAPAQPYEFRSKPAWQRLIIMLGGVTVNVILAILIFIFITWIWGEKFIPIENVKYGVYSDSLGKKIGVQDGDKIIAVGGKRMERVGTVGSEIIMSEAKSITVDRNGKQFEIPIPPGFINQLNANRLEGFTYIRIPLVVDTITKDAKISGGPIQKGDRLIAFNDTPVVYNMDLRNIGAYKDKGATLTLLRNNSDTVKAQVAFDAQGKSGIGYKGADQILGTKEINYSFAQAIPAGVKRCIETLTKYVQNLAQLFTSKEVKVRDSLGSVLSIGGVFPGVWDWQSFWTLTAIFSIILAFMNVLPIPALDGGHALFTLYEMITGRKPGDKFMEYAQMVGMVLLLGLMLYAFGLDIWRLFK